VPPKHRPSLVSAGLLVYRLREREIEVLLVHPGGPFWARKDLGAWSIPKGEAEAHEDLLECARRELLEETGCDLDGPFIPLDPVKQTKKTVYAWAVRGEFDVTKLESNTFQIEFPAHSGQVRSFPEVDRAEWFTMKDAREKILPPQRALLEQLEQRLAEPPVK
jgi:predicted NUDIX family NTP pyrophosphohydrolase